MLSPIRPACLPPVTRPIVLPEAQPQPQPQQTVQQDWRLTLGQYTPGPGQALPAGLVLWAHLGPKLADDAQAIGRGLAETAQGAWNAIVSGAQQLWSGLTGLFAQPQAQPQPSARLVLPAVPGGQVAPVAPSPAPVDTRALRRTFREELGRDATAAEIDQAAQQLREGASLKDVRQGWSSLPEARIARIFEDEIGRPIEPRGRQYWLNEYENGQSFAEIRERLRAHTDYMRAKGYIQ